MSRILAFFLIAAGCSSHNEQRYNIESLQKSAKSVCDVLADPRPYIGHYIIVEGVYKHDPHHRFLYDDACPNWELNVSHSIKEEKSSRIARLYRLYRMPARKLEVVYSGIFAADVIVSGCTDLRCSRYSLQNAQVLAMSLQKQ